MTTTYTGVDPRTLRQLAADVQQLTRPIHIAIRGRIVTHQCLLDQLRESIGPSRNPPSTSRHTHVAESRPPAATGPIDTLTTIHRELACWHIRLWDRLPPHGLPWQKPALRAMARYADQLAPAISEWLAVEVHDWWTLAGQAAGWKPTELLRLR